MVCLQADFTAFRETVDALGGVTVTVRAPIVDYNYPLTETRMGTFRIGSGTQLLDGETALRYARSQAFDIGLRSFRAAATAAHRNGGASAVVGSRRSDHVPLPALSRSAGTRPDDARVGTTPWPCAGCHGAFARSRDRDAAQLRHRR
jgi:hypothetical protein